MYVSGLFCFASEFIFDPARWPQEQMNEDFLNLSKRFNALRSVVRVPLLDPKYKIAVLASKQVHSVDFGYSFSTFPVHCTNDAPLLGSLFGWTVTWVARWTTSSWYIVCHKVNPGDWYEIINLYVGYIQHKVDAIHCVLFFDSNHDRQPNTHVIRFLDDHYLNHPWSIKFYLICLFAGWQSIAQRQLA